MEFPFPNKIPILRVYYILRYFFFTFWNCNSSSEFEAVQRFGGEVIAFHRDMMCGLHSKLIVRTNNKSHVIFVA